MAKGDSPIQKVEDLKGTTVAFPDQASSSGYFMPVYMLHEAGWEQRKDYKAIFAGGHEGSFAALEQGQVDAACTAVVLTRMDALMFPFAEGEWRAVGQSPAMDVVGTVLASLDEQTHTVLELLDRVGVAHKAKNRPDRSAAASSSVWLSRGRSCSSHTSFSPTIRSPSLDPKLADSVLGLLRQIATEDGVPVLVSLHVLPLALTHSDRIVGLRHAEMLVSARTADLGAETLAVLYDEEGNHDDLHA